MDLRFSLEQLTFKTIDGNTTTGARIAVQLQDEDDFGPKLVITFPVQKAGASAPTQAAETALRLARQLLQPDLAAALLAQAREDWEPDGPAGL